MYVHDIMCIRVGNRGVLINEWIYLSLLIATLYRSSLQTLIRLQCFGVFKSRILRLWILHFPAIRSSDIVRSCSKETKPNYQTPQTRECAVKNDLYSVMTYNKVCFWVCRWFCSLPCQNWGPSNDMKKISCSRLSGTQDTLRNGRLPKWEKVLST